MGGGGRYLYFFKVMFAPNLPSYKIITPSRYIHTSHYACTAMQYGTVYDFKEKTFFFIDYQNYFDITIIPFTLTV